MVALWKRTSAWHVKLAAASTGCRSGAGSAGAALIHKKSCARSGRRRGEGDRMNRTNSRLARAVKRALIPATLKIPPRTAAWAGGLLALGGGGAGGAHTPF